MTKRSTEDLLRKLANLPPGQRRVASSLIEGKGKSYQGVAEELELSIGTVYRHLKRIRDSSPATYQLLMAYRKGQLVQRHKESLKKARAHSDRWFRRERNRRFYYRFGYWPWER